MYGAAAPNADAGAGDAPKLDAPNAGLAVTVPKAAAFPKAGVVGFTEPNADPNAGADVVTFSKTGPVDGAVVEAKPNADPKAGVVGAVAAADPNAGADVAGVPKADVAAVPNAEVGADPNGAPAEPNADPKAGAAELAADPKAGVGGGAPNADPAVFAVPKPEPNAPKPDVSVAKPLSVNS